MSYEGPVRVTPDLHRILKLQRRELDFDSPEVLELARTWSPQLLNDLGKREWARITALPEEEQQAEFDRFAKPKNEGGENCPLLMLPAQAIMLYESFHQKGMFASASVGAGKTLVAFLLALILGAERPMMLIPGGLDGKTEEEFKDLAKYWQAPRVLPEIVSYEKLGQPQNALLLCNCKLCAGTKDEPQKPAGVRPTHIIADESDRLRNPVGVTKRVGRYISKHVDTCYFGMTGTAWRKSIKDSAPQIIWALKWKAPVPLSYTDTKEWSEALDLSTRGIVRDPGALAWLAGVDPLTIQHLPYQERIDFCAEAFQQRLLQTPGIIQTEGQSCKQPLVIRLLKAPDDPVIDDAFKQFRKTRATLDGWDVDDPLSELRYATEMSIGFYYFWDPRPPQEWLEARSNASRRVSEIIRNSAHSGRPLDTKAQVYRLYPEDPILRAWKEIEPTFIPNTVARPISASVLGYAVQWIKQNGPALVWVRHSYVGKALSAMAGIPYFGSKGKDSTGRYIMKHSPRESAIVSLAANLRGRNLQAWNRNLVLGPPPEAPAWEQGICGRTHRKGQNNTVYVDVIVGCAENLYAVTKARAETDWVRTRSGAVGKLLIADFVWDHYPAADLEALPHDHPSRDRWARAA